ncbi:MAG: hypothetical protein ACHP6I_01550 [Rickettsiales bacterium]
MTILNSKHRTGEPLNLPISLESAKLYLKISHKLEDALIVGLIKSTTNTFELYTGIALINQEWQIGYRQFSTLNLSLPIKPIQEIINITLQDVKGRFIKFNGHHYHLEANELSFLVFPCSYIVKIHLKAGFGKNETTIPEDIKAALLNHIAYLYENRGNYRDQNTKIFEQFKGVRV